MLLPENKSSLWPVQGLEVGVLDERHSIIDATLFVTHLHYHLPYILLIACPQCHH